MDIDKIPYLMAETKYFLDALLSKDKLKHKKTLGLTHQQYREMINNGIAKLVVQARDKMIMAKFIESKGLIDELNKFSNNAIMKMKEEYGSGNE